MIWDIPHPYFDITTKVLKIHNEILKSITNQKSNSNNQTNFFYIWPTINNNTRSPIFKHIPTQKKKKMISQTDYKCV